MPGDRGGEPCESSNDDRASALWASLALRLGVRSRHITPEGGGVSVPNAGLGIMGMAHINAHTTVGCSVYALSLIHI